MTNGIIYSVFVQATNDMRVHAACGHSPSEANLIRCSYSKNQRNISKQDKTTMWLSNILNNPVTTKPNAGSQCGLEDVGNNLESSKEMTKLVENQYKFSSDPTKDSRELKDSTQETGTSSRSVSYDDAKYAVVCN